MSEKRAKNGQFLPGNVNNPGGRPKENPEAKAILKAAAPDAACALVELLKSKNEKIRFQAAQAILDRTQGKPENMNKVEFSDISKNKFTIQWITEQNQEQTQQPQTAN